MRAGLTRYVRKSINPAQAKRIHSAERPLPAFTRVTHSASRIHPIRYQQCPLGESASEFHTDNVIGNTGRKCDDANRGIQELELGENSTEDWERLAIVSELLTQHVYNEVWVNEQ